MFVLTFLVKPFWIFGIDRAVQNQTGEQAYGFYYTLYSIAFLFSAVLDFGINTYNTKQIASNKHAFKDNFSELLLTKCLLFVCYFCATLGFAFANHYNLKMIYGLCFMALNQALVGFILFLRSNLSGLHLYAADSVGSVLDRLITIMLCIPLIYTTLGNRFLSINTFIYSQTLALMATSLLIFYWLNQQKPDYKLVWHSKQQLVLLGQMLPFATLGLLMSFYNRIDVVLLSKFRSDVDVGIYSASYRMVDAVNMFAMLFGGLLLPMFSKLFTQNKPDELKNLVQLAAVLMFVGTYLVAVVCSVFDAELMQLLYTKSTAYYEQTFGYLIFSIIPIGSIYVFGTLLTATSELKFLNSIAAIALLFNVSANVVGLHYFGANAVEVAKISVCTQFFVAGSHFAYSFYALKLKPNWLLMAKILVFCVLSWGGIWLGRGYFVGNTYLAVGLPMVANVALFFGLKLLPLSYENVMDLVKKYKS